MSDNNTPPPTFNHQESLYGSFASIDDIAQAVIEGRINPDEWTVAQLTKMQINLNIWTQIQNDRRKTEDEAISRFTQEILRRQLESLSTNPNRNMHATYRADLSVNMQTASSWSANSTVEFSAPDDYSQANESAYDADLSQIVTEEEEIKIVEETTRWSEHQTSPQEWSPLAESSPRDYEENDYFKD